MKLKKIVKLIIVIIVIAKICNYVSSKLNEESPERCYHSSYVKESWACPYCGGSGFKYP